MNDEDPVQWDVDEPRKGWKGKWDDFIGPGATLSENILIITLSILAALLQLLYVYIGHLGWNLLQIVVAMLLAADIAGGTIANFSNVLKRWYHREDQTFLNHFKFVLTHIYPLIVGLLFRDWDWLYGIVLYAFLLISAIIVIAIGLFLLHRVNNLNRNPHS